MVTDKCPNGLIGLTGLNPIGLIGLNGLNPILPKNCSSPLTKKKIVRNHVGYGLLLKYLV